MFDPEFSGQDRQVQGGVHNSPDPDQGNLFSFEEELTVTERFEAFHALNPHVYTTLVRLARRYKQATGEDKQSVQRLVEIARWDEKIRTHGENGFEINNDFRPFYSRLIMWRERDLRGVFDLRRAPEADAWIADLRGDGEVAA
jgi:hypothetical protein